MPSVEINGADIHFDDIGTGDRVLVWGHCYLGSARLYTELIDQLPGYRSIAVDFRGFGRSAAATADFSFEQAAEDVYALTQHLGIEKFVYLGHSMGNAVGMRLAARHPEVVLAGVNLAGLPVSGLDEVMRPAFDMLTTLQGNAEGFAGMLGAMFVHEDTGAQVKKLAEDAARVAPEPFNAVNNVELWRDDSEVIEALTGKWLCLIPGADAAVPADGQLALARQIPGADAVWLNGEGHFYPLERPVECARWLRPYFEQVFA